MFWDSRPTSLPQTSNFGVARLDHDFVEVAFHVQLSLVQADKPTADQVDIGGFFPGDKLGTPASQSSVPQQAWFWWRG